MMKYTIYYFYSLIFQVAAAFLTVPQQSLISGLSTVGRVAFDFSIRASSQLDEEIISPATVAPVAEEEYDQAELLPQSDEFDPICRVVASSDNKLPPTIVSKLSQSSSALLKKIDLLYTAQSKKELRDLAYLQPASNKDTTPYNSMEEVVDNESEITKSKAYDMNQEEKLISILKRSLDDGGFKLMDQRDLDLCSALNAGYLLRLSLLPDLKNLESVGEEFFPSEETITNGDSDGMKQLILDGKVLIFRRGYTNEITKGRLLLPKLDYLQTSLVQRSTRSITMKLGGVERRLEEFSMDIVSQVNDYVQNLNRRLMKACAELMYDILDSVGLSNNTFVAKIMLSNNATSDAFADNYTQSGSDSSSRTMTSSATTTTARGNRIFKLNRYDVGSSFDISDATISSFIMCEIGNETTSVERDIYDAIDAGMIDSASIYKKSAVRLLERISIDNTVDFLSKKGRRTLLKNYFKSSTLLEPSYEEVVVIWRPAKKKLKRIKTLKPPRWLLECVKIFGIEERVPLLKNVTSQDDEDDETMLPLEIKAFNDVPMANILAVLPKNKLIFRPADAFVFDFVSLATFLATAASFKFDSPKLDLLALVSVVLFAVRTFFRYSNKYARYDLLVNKFLTSKLTHRGQGALNYLAQEANSQKALRAMCVRDWLSRSEERDGVISLTEGEAYINEEAFSGKSRINVDILSGIDDLKDLGQLTSTNTLVNDDEAEAEIKRIWDDTFQD